jgi:hypothetical protein
MVILAKSLGDKVNNHFRVLFWAFHRYHVCVVIPKVNIFEELFHMLNTFPRNHEVMLPMNHQALNYDTNTSALIFDTSISLLASAYIDYR